MCHKDRFSMGLDVWSNLLIDTSIGQTSGVFHGILGCAKIHFFDNSAKKIAPSLRSPQSSAPTSEAEPRTLFSAASEVQSGGFFWFLAVAYIVVSRRSLTFGREWAKMLNILLSYFIYVFLRGEGEEVLFCRHTTKCVKHKKLSPPPSVLEICK